MKNILNSRDLDFSNYIDSIQSIDISKIELFYCSIFTILHTKINEKFSVEKFIMQCNKKILLYPNGEYDEFYLELKDAWLLSAKREGKISTLDKKNIQMLDYFLCEKIVQEMSFKIEDIQELAILNTIEVLNVADNSCTCRGNFLFYVNDNIYLIFYDAEYADISMLNLFKEYNLPLLFY